MQRIVWRATFVSAVVAALMCAGLALSQAAAPAATVKITLKEFSFTPETLTLAPGPVRFVLTNRGGIEHDFMIEALKVDSGMIKPGQTVTIPVAGRPPVMLKKGTYHAYCMVPGHKEAGMAMAIVVK